MDSSRNTRETSAATPKSAAPKRPTTGRYSAKTPGLPNTDPRRADAKLRDFSGGDT